jgi:hypothetical protein
MAPLTTVFIIIIYCLSFAKVEAFVLVDFGQCEEAVNTSYFNDPTIGYLRDEHGNPTSNISTAWGITYPACLNICTAGQSFIEWNVFSPQFSTWLLPWLALTAQLPFETRSRAKNFQALYLAIGSPLLIIYSLTLTILTARKINSCFRQIKEEAVNMQKEAKKALFEILENVRIILIESQNIPLGIVNGPGRQIAQLVVNPRNGTWWSHVAGEIVKTKREWTYSLIAQLSMVIVAQLFSIIDYFTSAADDTTISVGLALNSLWIWMISVTLGWVFVGTQTSAGSIKAAIASATVPELGDETNVGGIVGLEDRTRYDGVAQRGERSRFGLGSLYFSRASRAYRKAHPHWEHPEVVRRGRGTQRARNAQESAENVELQELQRFLAVPDLERGDTQKSSGDSSTRVGSQENNDEGPAAATDSHKSWMEKRFGISFTGDDLEPGPIFNYARVWSHMNVLAYLVEAFTESIRHQLLKQSVSGQTWDPTNYSSNLRGSPENMSRYITAGYVDLEPFSIHSKSLSSFNWNCVGAALVAIILFWCTTGAGVLIAYETPTVGLGCDSAGYLLYGIIATFSCLLLLLSTYLSHLYSSALEPSPQPSKAIWWHATLALVTSHLGKSLAGLNALWLLCISVFQFTNLYNTCWCSSSIVSLHGNAWVVLFASDLQIEQASKAPWIGGVVLASMVAFASAAFFLGSRGDEIFEGNKN